ncbi:FKBP-type peptidyl-prolyl cis-trans isomerase [Mucilaginibacter sp. 21P]|uniref:FKBP-type peptidyl-prolyl cis-trans isomerase n=1 Tax=Mucilaginibacter sp. 21P TaxID=2778902 RepID=UPI001C57DB92|nr:FKBP-type peptidyl-prolyl cis-trans isomerase [Mucilaginibacter sp. 21P]QXV65369.1 FKBP-type peptidyl-prolyl cis-trans isomerase [Mucilaginibacter sp. 21P]
MKQRIFTFLVLALAGLTACKKNDNNLPDIQQYDDQQIQAYISANALTGFTKDETLIGDGATGLYYKLISPTTPGTGPDSLKYQDQVSVVYTLKSMDGKYVSTDTIANHYNGFLGYMTSVNTTTGFYFPVGAQLAVHNLLKYPGANIQVLIPSRLAYGVRGFGVGSITASGRIAGNQSLDMYVHVIKDQAAYDDQVIKNYFTANNLTGYTKDPLGFYYKVVTQGSGSVGEITQYSNVSATYVGSLLNGTNFDQSSQTTATTLTPYSLIDGFKTAILKYGSTGTSLSLFIPSALGYGTAQQSAGIPANSVLHFEVQIASVTQP